MITPAICWNSNQQDLQGLGLKGNFELVRAPLRPDLPCTSARRPQVSTPRVDPTPARNAVRRLGDVGVGRRVPADPVSELARQAQLFKKWTLLTASCAGSCMAA